MGIEKESVVLISKNASTSEIDGEKIMIDFETGKYFMIKGVGNDIWDRIQSEIKVSDLVASLLKEYDVDEKTCFDEVLSFLNKLNEYGFLTVK
ncbi:MAG: PqqD family peptide modification chaperone [Butyrivibrio sp.]|nr:PqqD family peptide modification chaperone [Butyrivibrio sp.]